MWPDIHVASVLEPSTSTFLLIGEDDRADPDRPGWQLYVVMWQLGIELDDVPELLAVDRALWRESVAALRTVPVHALDDDE